MSAIIAYNVKLCTAETDKAGVNKQKRFWTKFIDSLDWDNVTSKKKTDPLKAFGNLQNYIMNRGVKNG